ncbi:hypothetical protein NE237_001186 [Protea cynaroides]|uniref:Gamma tubulin complex component protein N-terminal domain-containing protein n=1 Tax=Protea cynaroides TaxID=273540 RepID=A0A9Q0QY85_9MAGN|nr:hypothetical protein NE237_001186 [Protea cynaroides]
MNHFISFDPNNIRLLQKRLQLQSLSASTLAFLVKGNLIYLAKLIDQTHVAIHLVTISICNFWTLYELGWLFRKARCYISKTMDRFLAKDVGTVGGRAFCAALQDELAAYYKWLSVIDAESMNPIPLVSETPMPSVLETLNSGNSLSLRRLSVWFAELMMTMRLIVVLIDSCSVLKLELLEE